MKPKQYSYVVINDGTIDNLYHKVASKKFPDVLSEAVIDSTVILFYKKLLEF